jgi:hypothetical protein
MAGCARWKPSIMSAIATAGQDVIVPIATRPRTSPVSSSTACFDPATAPSAARANGSTAAPASVSVTVRPVRSSSGRPSSRSSCLICALTPGCATCRRSAARVKLASSATATKYSSWRSSITMDSSSQLH